ncbi:exopolysaccharide biosynthesis protein [Parapedomonas caeni]
MTDMPDTAPPADTVADDARSSPPPEDRSPPRRHLRLSELLRQFADGDQGGDVALGDIVAGVGERGFGILLILFSLPVAIPSPIPGISAIFGAPLLLIAGQLLLGFPQPWLPAVLARRSIARADLARLLSVIEPWMQRLERFARPRLNLLPEAAVARLVGLFCLLLALVVFLPVPLGNVLPSIAILLFGFSLLERDGLLLLLATLTGVASLVIVAGVVYALARLIAYFIMKLFGLAA